MKPILALALLSLLAALVLSANAKESKSDYLEQLKNAHDVSFSLQLSGKSTRSDIHLDDKGLQTLQAACGAILNYLPEELR